MFGAYPVQVQGYINLYDSLEGGMARGRIEPANNVHAHQSDQEVKILFCYIELDIV